MTVKSSALAVLLAGCLLGGSACADETSSPAALSEMLKSVPDGALAFVVVKSIDEAEAGVYDFTAAVSDEAEGMTFDEPLGGYAKDLGDRGGLDRSAPAALVLIGGPQPGDDPDSIAVIPISDYGVWRESWGDSIAMEEGGKHEYTEGFYGERHYFVKNGNYVIFADDPEALDLWSGQSGSHLSGAAVRAIEG